MALFIKHDIDGYIFLLLPQDDGHNEIIGRTLLLLPQEDGNNFWFRIVKIIDDHGTKVAQDPGLIQFISSINDDQYEKVMSCNNSDNHIVKGGD